MSSTFWIEWARRFSRQLAIISGLTILSAVATLAVPWLAAQLLAGVVTESADPIASFEYSQTLGLLALALVSLTVLNIGAAILSQSASLQILTELRKDIYRHVQLMPMQFHDDARAGDVLALTSYEVGNLSDFLANTLANVPAMVLTASGAILILFWIDPVMALIVPVLIPIFYLLVKLAGRRLREVSRQVRAADVKLIALAKRDLDVLPAIKAFAREDHHLEEFSLAAEKSRDLSIRRAKLGSAIGPIVGLLAAFAAIAVLIAGSSQVASNGQSPAELFAFLFYAALLTRPIGGLANIYGAYQMARGTLGRLETVLGLEVEPGYRTGRQISRANGALDFEGVTFSYPGRPAVLKGVDCTVGAGEIVAFTGENGIGKSTLVRLLLRFYELDAGRITLDGQDIRDIQIQSLREQFGYVPQRALLFNGTIAENIAFGCSAKNEEETRAAIIKAAEMAQVSGFADGLPAGLDTEIGDNGIRLSGGQRQRIALARALYRDPPVYILDEATSMYDLESEAAFVENCIHALKDRTVIIITHRPASLALADRVLRVKGDEVIETEA